jgi:hypothetical protein
MGIFEQLTKPYSVLMESLQRFAMSVEEKDLGPSMRAVISLEDCIFRDSPPTQRVSKINGSDLPVADNAVLSTLTARPGFVEFQTEHGKRVTASW